MWLWNFLVRLLNSLLIVIGIFRFSVSSWAGFSKLHSWSLNRGIGALTSLTAGNPNTSLQPALGICRSMSQIRPSDDHVVRVYWENLSISGPCSSNLCCSKANRLQAIIFLVKWSFYHREISLSAALMLFCFSNCLPRCPCDCFLGLHRVPLCYSVGVPQKSGSSWLSDCVCVSVCILKPLFPACFI